MATIAIHSVSKARWLERNRYCLFLQCRPNFFWDDLGTSLNISGQRPYAEQRFSNFPLQFIKRLRSYHYETDSSKSQERTPTPRAFAFLIFDFVPLEPHKCNFVFATILVQAWISWAAPVSASFILQILQFQFNSFNSARRLRPHYHEKRISEEPQAYAHAACARFRCGEPQDHFWTVDEILHATIAFARVTFYSHTTRMASATSDASFYMVVHIQHPLRAFAVFWAAPVDLRFSLSYSS